MVNSWLDDNTANRHKQTYVKGFVDISGGDLILRNGQQYMDSSYNYSTTDISDNSITSTIEITENPVWSQLGHSILPIDTTSTYRNIDMSKDGTIIIVGERSVLSNRGIAQVFQYTNNAWTQLGVDLSGNNAGDYFGQMVAINADGTIIAVGTEGGDYCKVFEYDVAADGSWNQLGPDITGSTTDNFGSAVSLDASGHRLAVSDRNALSQYGYIEVYDYDSVGNTWSIVGSRVSGTNASTYFGQSLRLSGDGSTFIAGGAGWNTFDGLVKVYKYDSGTTNWTQLGSTFYGNTASTHAYLGAAAVAISYDGSIIAMGEGQNDEDGTNKGKIHTYIYNTSTSSWDQLGEDIFGREDNSYLGQTFIDLTDDGTIMAVGEVYGVTANASDQATTYATVGYIYKYTNGAWKLLGQPIEHFDTDYFATAHSSSGGCISNDGTIFSIVQIGHVRVFELSQITNYVSNPTYKTTTRTGNYNIRLGDISNNNTALSVTKNYTTVTHDISGTYSDSYTHYPLLGDNALPSHGLSSTSYTQLGVDISTELTTYPDSAMDASGNRVMLASASGVNVYEYNHFTWTQLGSTIGLGSSNGELRQAVFSGNGEYVATYAASSDYRVYVYKYNSSTNTWEDYGDPSSPTGLPNNGNGVGVEISYDGQTIIVGEDYYYNNGNANNGRATVWEYTGDGTTHSWTQLGGDIILFNGAQNLNGRDVAINKTGNIIAVGAMGYDGTGTDAGVFAVFKYNADATNATSGLQSHTGWELLGSIFYGPTTYHYYGMTLRLNDDGYTLAHGGRGGTNVARYVQLYRYSEESSDWYAYAYARSEDNNDGFADGDFSLAISGDGEMVMTGSRGYGYGMARQYKAANGKLEPVGPSFYGDSTYDDYGYVGMSSDGKRVLVASAVHDIARVFQLNDVQQTITAHTYKNTETETQDYIHLGNKTSGNMLEIKGTSEITGDMTFNSTGTYQYIDISHVPQSIVLMDENEVYHNDVSYNGALSGYYCAVSSGVVISSYVYSAWRSFQAVIGQQSPEATSIPSATYNSGTYVGSVITSYKESKTDTSYTDLSGDYLQFEFPFMIKPYEFNYVGVNPYWYNSVGTVNNSDISYGMLVGWDGTEWLKLTAIQQSDYNLYGVTKYDLSSNTHYINKFRIIANSSVANSQISIGAPYLSGTIRTGTVPSMAITSTDTDIKFDVSDLSMAGNLTIEANTFTLKNKDLNTDSDVNLIKYFPQAVGGNYAMSTANGADDTITATTGGASLWMANIIHHTGSNSHFNGGYLFEVSDLFNTDQHWSGCNPFLYHTDNARTFSARHFMEQSWYAVHQTYGWLGSVRYDLNTGAYTGTNTTTFVDMNGNTHNVGGEYLELHTPLPMKYKKFHYYSGIIQGGGTHYYDSTNKVMFVGKKNNIYYQLSYPETLLKNRFYNSVELDRTDLFVSSIRIIVLEAYEATGRAGITQLSFDAIPSIDTHLEITNNEFGTVFNAYDKGAKGNIILNEAPHFNKAYLLYENTSNNNLNITSNAATISKLLSNPTGYVGIGTNKPSAPLTVYGYAGLQTRRDTGGAFAWDYSGVYGHGNANYNIFNSAVIYTPGLLVPATIRTASEIISHGGILIASDERIKTNVKDIDDGEALDILRILKPKTYEYINNIRRNEPSYVYGFMAQDVSAALPYSVKLERECVPNIYELADISNGSIVLTNNTTDVFTRVPELDGSGNTIQDASGNTIYRLKNKTLKCMTAFGDDFEITIKEIVDDKRFTVKESITIEQKTQVDVSGNLVKDKLFIVGEVVDDFHTLKKDAIWTIATAAAQEVDRKLQEEKEKVAQMETQVAALLARVETLKNKAT